MKAKGRRRIETAFAVKPECRVSNRVNADSSSRETNEEIPEIIATGQRPPLSFNDGVTSTECLFARMIVHFFDHKTSSKLMESATISSGNVLHLIGCKYLSFVKYPRKLRTLINPFNLVDCLHCFNALSDFEE